MSVGLFRRHKWLNYQAFLHKTEGKAERTSLSPLFLSLNDHSRWDEKGGLLNGMHLRSQ